jgi:DNA helicase HerA-like ATPase
MKNNPTTENHIVDNSIFRIGQVVEILGQEVKVKVDSGKNTSSLVYKGEIIQNISVGGYIKIKKGFEVMIGKIEGEFIKEEKNTGTYSNNQAKIHRILNVKILGFLDKQKFKRGVKELPLIDNTCYLLTKEEFNEIHDFVEKEDEPIEVGVLEYDDSQKIKLGINKLFASHIGIFGNTGSGKSYTLAKILREVLKKFKDEDNFKKNAKFFLIDFNGEYIGQLKPDGSDYENKNVIIEESIDSKKYKNIYELTTSKEITEILETDKFPVHNRTLKNVTFWAIFLEATEKTQMPFLNRAIKDTYIEGKLSNDDDLNNLIKEKVLSATSVNGRNIDRTLTQDMLFEIANYLGNDSLKDIAHYFRENLFGGNENISFYLEQNIPGNYSGEANFIRLIDNKFSNISDVNIHQISPIKKIGLRIIIKYYDEMIRGFSNREHLSPLIKRLDKRILDLEKVLTIKSDEVATNTEANFTIISLRDVNLDIRKMIPMLLAKEVYEEKKAKRNKDESLHIIVDEAHNILSENSDRESKEWKDYRLETFEEIIKEGRKFGAFLIIASQRPSDISSTIISQLHNYFLHRLINNNDLKAVEKTIAYLDKVSADSIPNLATGTCILAGIIAQIPVVMKVGLIDKKEYEPQSHNIDLLKKWR